MKRGQWGSNNDGNLDMEDIEKQAQRAEYRIERNFFEGYGYSVFCSVLNC